MATSSPFNMFIPNIMIRDRRTKTDQDRMEWEIQFRPDDPQIPDYHEFFTKTLTQINISKWPRSNLSNEFIFTCNNKMWFIWTWNRIIRRLSWHSENISLDSLSQKIGSPTRIHIFMIQNSINLSHIFENDSSIEQRHEMSHNESFQIQFKLPILK